MSKVLVIEDDPGIQSLLAELLHSEGHEVHLQSDGQHAVEWVRYLQPDLVLLDIGLPMVHGLAVLDALQADEILCRIPVVLISAWRRDTLVERALCTGAVDFLPKPFATDELKACVARVLHGIRSPRLEMHVSAPLEVLQMPEPVAA